MITLRQKLQLGLEGLGNEKLFHQCVEEFLEYQPAIRLANALGLSRRTILVWSKGKSLPNSLMWVPVFQAMLTLLPNSKFEIRELEGTPFIKHPGSVVILGTYEDKFIFIRSFRSVVQDWVWELPAGTLDKIGEDPIDAACRELKEETGYSALYLHKMGEFYTSPGYTTEKINVYLAEETTPGSQNLQPREKIEVHLLSRREIENLIEGRKIQDAKTLSALYLYGL